MAYTTYRKPIILSENVDFSYKENALRTTYDDESTLEAWTCAFINDYSFSFMFFGDEQFDDLKDEDIIAQMKAFAAKRETKKYMGIKNPDDLEYILYRYHVGDENSMRKLALDMKMFQLCKPLRGDKAYLHKHSDKRVDFVEYASWNGSAYDVILNILISMAAARKGAEFTPRDIRQMSNWVINCKVPDWRKGKYFEEISGGFIEAKAFNRALNIAKWADGHIDYAKLAKSAIEATDEKVTPPGLKKEMARFGLDIIIDEIVTYETYHIWTDEERANLVEYNFNDVLGTKVIGTNDVIESELAARDAVRHLYPYTSARAVSLDKDIERMSPPERDMTSASLSGLVLIGPKRIKSKDYETVRYDFPVPATRGDKENEKIVDLLDYIIEKEEFVHPYFIEFFGHFRGKDTRDFMDDKRVKLSQPITHDAKMNLPYYKDGKPIDAYIRFSTGGAHGSTCAGLRLKSPEEIEAWIRSDEGTGGKSENRFTVDKTGVIHADFTSFYPMMAKKMKLYLTEDGQDRYTPMIDHRVEVKAQAEVLKEEDKTKTPEYAHLQSLQLAFKLVLNATTGAANMHRPNSNLPLDNKTLSMRLIGNMLIWVLGQRFAQAGAFIISTNTDGLFLSGLTVDEAQEIIDDYIADYNMPVDPEYVTRFINATTSTRVEFDHKEDEPSRAGGTLGHAITLEFSPFSIGRNVSIPLISANAVLHYMATDKDWLQKPYDRNRMRAYIVEQQKQARENEQAWYHVHTGTKAAKLTANGERLQKVNRVVFTNKGYKLGGENLRKLKASEMTVIWNEYIKNGSVDWDKVVFPEVDFYEYETEFEEYIKSHDEVKLDFVVKSKEGKVDVFSPTEQEHIEIPEFNASYATKTAYEADKKLVLGKFKSKDLGYYDEDNDLWHQIKIWKMSDKVTNYPYLIGKTLNSAEELHTFDYDELNIDAYVQMAEEQLKLWKKSADVPQLGMKKVDDTVVKAVKVSSKKRKTKKEKLFEALDELYVIDALVDTDESDDLVLS